MIMPFEYQFWGIPQLLDPKWVPWSSLGNLTNKRWTNVFGFCQEIPKKRKRFFSPFLYMEENGYPAKMIDQTCLILRVVLSPYP